MVVLNIKTPDNQKYIRAFSRINKEIKNFSLPLELIYDNFTRVSKNVFDKQGTPKKFVKLTKRYKRWKDKHYPGKKILQLTGRLYNSMTKQTPDTIKEIGNDYAVFGTDVFYAGYHQLGTKKMPARKFVQITDKIKMGWDKIVHRWAVGIIEKNLGNSDE